MAERTTGLERPKKALRRMRHVLPRDRVIGFQDGRHEIHTTEGCVRLVNRGESPGLQGGRYHRTAFLQLAIYLTVDPEGSD